MSNLHPANLQSFSLRGALATLPILLLVGNASAATDILNREVLLINSSSHTIKEFHSSDVTDPWWGPNILGIDVLPPGYSVKIDFDNRDNHCKFDFKAVLLDDSEFVRPDVNICAISFYTYTD